MRKRIIIIIEDEIPDEPLPGNTTLQPWEYPCMHENCSGCRNGTCSGVHGIACPCPKCSPRCGITSLVNDSVALPQEAIDVINANFWDLVSNGS